MKKTITSLAAAVALAVPAIAEAHTPSKRAVANDAVYAAESKARAQGFGILNSGTRARITRKTAHARFVRVLIPIYTKGEGVAVYRVKVTHSGRTRTTFLYALSATTNNSPRSLMPYSKG